MLWQQKQYSNGQFRQGHMQGGWVGLKTPLELDILQKLYYLRKGN